MNENIDSIAVTLGAITTTVAMFGALALYLTHDKPPLERRALRLGMVAAILSATFVLLGEVALYRHFPTVGLFMAIPTVVLTILALIFGGYRAYRALGGGQQSKVASGTPAIEPQTHEQQGAIWCQLRDLPHFRETLGGPDQPRHGRLRPLDRLSW